MYLLHIFRQRTNIVHCMFEHWTSEYKYYRYIYAYTHTYIYVLHRFGQSTNIVCSNIGRMNTSIYIGTNVSLFLTGGQSS